MGLNTSSGLSIAVYHFFSYGEGWKCVWKVYGNVYEDVCGIAFSFVIDIAVPLKSVVNRRRALSQRKSVPLPCSTLR